MEVAEFADLASLAGKPAQIAVSVTRARRVEWRRLRVIGRGAEGERPDRTIRAAEKAPNIVVYVVDALRPDALSAYGGPIPTPAFDSLAQDGARFEPALTTSTWTRPATASLLTGLYPSAHGALDRPHVLAESLFTLPDRLRLLGYRTVAVVANGNIDRVWGFWDSVDRGETQDLGEARPQLVEQLATRGSAILSKLIFNSDVK